jgi:hypothetical protein
LLKIISPGDPTLLKKGSNYRRTITKHVGYIDRLPASGMETNEKEGKLVATAPDLNCHAKIAQKDLTPCIGCKTIIHACREKTKHRDEKSLSLPRQLVTHTPANRDVTYMGFKTAGRTSHERQ